MTCCPVGCNQRVTLCLVLFETSVTASECAHARTPAGAYAYVRCAPLCACVCTQGSVRTWVSACPHMVPSPHCLVAVACTDPKPTSCAVEVSHVDVQVGLEPDVACVPDIVEDSFFASGREEPSSLRDDPCIALAESRLLASADDLTITSGE
jgi:hypothetical protein